MAVALVSRGNDARAAAALTAGWNNIAYTGGAAAPGQALKSLEGKYSVVYRWDGVAKKYEIYAPGAPEIVNTLTTVNPGDALWVHVTAASAELSTGGFGGTMSVPASAFLPASDLALYQKDYNQLNPIGADTDSQRYYAPVNLPDGANVTNLTAHFTGTGIRVRLDYTPIANGADASKVFILAEANSTAGASPQSIPSYAHKVDNKANVYFIVVDLTAGATSKLNGVSISYTGG
jgi:hypothetical protein